MNTFNRHIDPYLDNEIVLFSDERQPVHDTIRPPFRWICSLEVEFPEPVLYSLGPLENPGITWEKLEPSIRGCGTGLFISRQNILTAAHVITGLKIIRQNREGKPLFKLIRAKKVKVIPGRNEENILNPRPFGQFLGRCFRINPGFQTLFESKQGLDLHTIKRALSFDTGIVKIVGGRGKHPGWWGREEQYKLSAIIDPDRHQLQRKKVHLAGYQGDKGRISCGALYYSSDQVSSAFYRINGKMQNLLLYQADTYAGMSGSPIWIKEKGGGYRLVGVHSSFLEMGKERRKNGARQNVGVLLKNQFKN
ncbi:MAG: trypsin-like peptidase domain-containing protein [Bacteroidetes bacterium]|nr:trypsin-like peptidase domain-containing protein [Bacteroidota bacterium]